MDLNDPLPRVVRLRGMLAESLPEGEITPSQALSRSQRRSRSIPRTMRRWGAYIGATALALAAVAVTASLPAGYTAEVPEYVYCSAGVEAAVAVLEANRTPKPERGYVEPTVIKQGEPLVLTGPGNAPVRFTVAAQLPAGYHQPQVGEARRRPPALPAEVDSGIGAASAGEHRRVHPGIPQLHLHFARSNNPSQDDLLASIARIRMRRPALRAANGDFQYCCCRTTNVLHTEPTAGPTATTEQKPPPPNPCVVPALKHRTLKAATTELLHDHCKLGRVTHPHNHDHAQVVVHQSRKPGTRLPQGTKIAVTLGYAR